MLANTAIWEIDEYWKNVLRRLEPTVKCVSRRKATICKHGYAVDLRGS